MNRCRILFVTVIDLLLDGGVVPEPNAFLTRATDELTAARHVLCLIVGTGKRMRLNDLLRLNLTSSRELWPLISPVPTNARLLRLATSEFF